jgi:carboxypeptidase Taq
VENIIGRSYEFWTYFFPVMKKVTGPIFSDLNPDDFYFALNHVKPSTIRIEADELTYCLHIIIRFEIERDLIEGKIQVADLPQIWNQKYLDYLNVKVENDSAGVMQDTHWANGDFGYFSTYALGNIYSVQISNTMLKDVPNWKNQIAQGNFNEIKQWLIENVYHPGNLYDPTDLLRKISGEEIKIEHYLNYLTEKYSKLYGF